jgi:hypothetical protein
MAFPFTFKQKTEIVASFELKKEANANLVAQINKKLLPLQLQNMKREGEQITFAFNNGLFSIATLVSIKWKIAKKIKLEIEYDMSNFLWLLSGISLLIGLLGSMAFRYYLVVTFISALALYAINFYILSVYFQKFTYDIFVLTFPDYMENLEIESRKLKYSDEENDYSKVNHSKNGEFTIHFDYLEKDKKDK